MSTAVIDPSFTDGFIAEILYSDLMYSKYQSDLAGLTAAESESVAGLSEFGLHLCGKKSASFVGLSQDLLLKSLWAVIFFAFTALRPHTQLLCPAHRSSIILPKSLPLR